MEKRPLSLLISIFFLLLDSHAYSAVLQPRDGAVTEGEFGSGDNTFYDYPDLVPICGRGVLSETCAQRGWWEDPDGEQVQWHALKEAERATLLQTAIIRGTRLKSSMGREENSMKG